MISFVLGALCAGALVGFVTGLGLVKRAQQWCPAGGVAITTEHCSHPAAVRWKISHRASGLSVHPGAGSSSSLPQFATAESRL